MSEERMRLTPSVRVWTKDDELLCPQCGKATLQGSVAYHYHDVPLFYAGEEGAYLDATVDADVFEAPYSESNLSGIHCYSCDWRIDLQKDDVLIVKENSDA